MTIVGTPTPAYGHPFLEEGELPSLRHGVPKWKV